MNRHYAKVVGKVEGRRASQAVFWIRKLESPKALELVAAALGERAFQMLEEVLKK